MKLTKMMILTGTRSMTIIMATIMSFLTAAKNTTTRRKMGYRVMERRTTKTTREKKHQVKRKMVYTTLSRIISGIKTVILPVMLSTSTWQIRRPRIRFLHTNHLQTKKTQKKTRATARAQSMMLMTILDEDVDDVEVSDAEAGGHADTQLLAVRCRIRPKPSPNNNNNNNNHNSNINRADAQLELHIHSSNSNRTSINNRSHLKTLSSSLFSSIGKIRTLSNEPCLCTMTDMDHHRVSVVDVVSRGAVVLEDNNSVGLHLLNNSNLLL